MSALILFKGQEHTQGKGSENSSSALITWRICTLIAKKINMHYTTYYVVIVCVTESKYEEQVLS